MKINETAMSKSYQHPEEGLYSMKTATRLIALTLLLTSTFFVSSALACTTDAWTSTGGAPLADDPTNDVNRVSGFCGLKVTGLEHVVDNSPEAETTFIARFYVFPKNMGAGTHEIFAAYSDEAGTKKIFITYDGTNINIDATAFAGGGIASAPADPTHWNLVEFKWESGVDGTLWVNADATTTPSTYTFASGAGSIEQVRMGTLTDLASGNALFDDYESHRSLPVGELLMGDVNGNGSLTIADAIGLFNELNGTLQPGQPDCNSSGAITIADAICLFNAL